MFQRKQSVLSCVEECDELKRTHSSGSIESCKELQTNSLDPAAFSQMAVEKPANRSNKPMKSESGDNQRSLSELGRRSLVRQESSISGSTTDDPELGEIKPDQ